MTESWPTGADPRGRLKFGADGLIPAVIQRHDNGEVLMVGYMDRTAVERTLTSGRVWFWSRSRQAYWRKGDTSGHVQFVKSVAADCDGDALLVRVEQIGPACHTGTPSCFTGRELLTSGREGADSGKAGPPDTVGWRL
ncbi:MAG: phosphoribosyl-AMP cyclohydrolase [Bifidobacteriaceae bacterium]|nr:phosphoribosyl-AMP cyclohydrolase [Bifidobacteriaceae bacterium]